MHTHSMIVDTRLGFSVKYVVGYGNTHTHTLHRDREIGERELAFYLVMRLRVEVYH